MKKFIKLTAILLLLSGCNKFSFRETEADIFEPVEKRLVWKQSQMPLKVTLSPELSSFTPQVKDAIKNMNRSVGCEVLRLGGGSDVTIALGEISKLSNDADGYTYGMNMGETNQTALINLYGASDVGSVYLVTYHELGHALGLTHDLRGSSVMVPNASDYANTFPYPEISDGAAHALSTLYCKPKSQTNK